jgi:hypothetical protein
MPDEALWASPNLITFRRETVHQTIPTAGGETDPSTGVIRVFDVGLGSQSYPRSRSLQLPATMQTLTHEVGHIVMSRISQSVRDKFFENLLHWHDYPWAWITARTSTHSTWQAERTRLRNALGFTDTQLDAWLSNLVVDRPVIEGDYTYVKRSHTRGGTSFYLQSYRTTEVPAGREFEYAREKRGEYLAELYALAVSRPEFLHTTLPTNQVTWLKREIFQTPTNLSELAREVALPEPYQTQFILLGSRLFTWVQLNSLLNMLTTESRQEGTRVA